MLIIDYSFVLDMLKSLDKNYLVNYLMLIFGYYKSSSKLYFYGNYTCFMIYSSLERQINDFDFLLIIV